MKKFIIQLPIFWGIVLLIFSIPAMAQQVSDMKGKSILSSNNIAIDGKATEWDTKSLVHSSANNINYAITNDDHNLYLIVQATNHTIVNKILGGGVTLIINTSGKKDLKNAVGITYPVPDLHNRVWVDIRPSTEVISKRSADSTMNIANTNLTNRSKFIMVTGIKDVDTLVSVYNTDGIRASAQFDNKMIYTYELAIDLKQLGIDVNSTDVFAYNIRLSGVDLVAVYKESGLKTTTVQGMVIPTGRIPGAKTYNLNPSLPTKVHMVDFTNPTDFWGEYTLVKK
jgi:hypothetical protein